MTNNDILRRLRYTFDFNDSKMIDLLNHPDYAVDREMMSDWLKKEEDPAYKECRDVHLAVFLNNLIDDKRGKKEGAQPSLEKHLSNNVILRKLKIALNIKDEDIIEIIKTDEFNVSKHELSALFRKKGHKHHRVCKDQFLRKFLQGIQNKYRPEN